MNKLLIKRAIGKFWPKTLSQRKVILLYHSIGNEGWALPEKKFIDQINWLSDHCQVLSLSDLLANPFNKGIQVAITFDDGYSSLYDRVAPLFAVKKMAGMVYLNTGSISPTSIRIQSNSDVGHYPEETFLTWQEVRTLSKNKWEIGSHGVNHHDFTKISDNLCFHELTTSKQEIETNLEIKCDSFAYPWGLNTYKLRDLVRKAQYQSAVTTIHQDVSRKIHPYAIPRMHIDRSYSLQDFKELILGNWDYLKFIHKIKKYYAYFN